MLIQRISITRNVDLEDILHLEGGVTQIDLKHLFQISQIKKNPHFTLSKTNSLNPLKKNILWLSAFEKYFLKDKFLI